VNLPRASLLGLLKSHHWLALRPVGAAGLFFNLDSLLPEPEPVGDAAEAHARLDSLRAAGGLVFVVTRGEGGEGPGAAAGPGAGTITGAVDDHAG
jgi:hypothetical protein